MKIGSNFKNFLLYKLPYIFYILSLIYWFYDSLSDDSTINYLAIVSAMVIFAQMVFQNKIAGALIGLSGMVIGIFFLSLSTPYNILISIPTCLMGLLLTITSLHKFFCRKVFP